MERGRLSLSLFGVLLCMVTWEYAVGDVYLHNPRGSNNRLNDEGRARDNANSLFDSQNNNRGGYNVGSLFYYQGTVLPIEWTNQHSCGNENNNCELVIQYMCEGYVRDGTTSDTIPTDQSECANNNCDTDTEYRMHENRLHYAQCRHRLRNEGLFTADKDLDDQAIYTRQNEDGDRYGYECPEERDYYPYWHPSPWKDIVVMTNDISRCEYYQQESQNVKSRFDCIFPEDVMVAASQQGILLDLPNNEADCNNYELPDDVPAAVRTPVWTEFPDHGIPPPDCIKSPFSRDNHNGNGVGGHPNMYNWTIPNLESEHCALRIRYNISTNDFDSWSVDSSNNADSPNRPSKINIAADVGLTGLSEREIRRREYVFTRNPDVKIFDGLNMELELAINTAQFGRTFQDRSHSFGIRGRPKKLRRATIHNLNVRGKRGNIVQVYPAVEYDFVPNILETNQDDFVHIQWTGSNFNPQNNDGEGRAGTDRSNIVLLASQNYPEGDGTTDYSGGKYGHYGNNYPMTIENSTFLGVNEANAFTLAFVNPGQNGGYMPLLDDAGTYFNLDPVRLKQPGTYHYMCTRNNNFSNRDQKGRVIVKPKN